MLTDAGPGQPAVVVALLVVMLHLSGLPLALGLLSPMQLGEQHGTHYLVYSPAGFVQALSNPMVARIDVAEDLLMSEDAWPLHTIHITRNLTVESSYPERRLINYASVWSKVFVESGVHLVFHNVIMSGMSIGSSFTFLAASPGAVIMMHGGAWKAPVCPPYGKKMMSLMTNHPRPPEYPGLQLFGPMVHPFCIGSVCYKHTFFIHDWASSRPLEKDMLELGAYTAVLTHMVWACDVSFTDACVNRKGYEVCRREALALHIRGSRNTYSRRWGAGVLVLAGLLIAAITAVFMVHTSRQLIVTMPLSTSALVSAGHSCCPKLQVLLANRRSLSPASVRSPVSRRRMGHGSRNHVELDHLLGAGSFGEVYQGFWRGQVVAVKIITHDRQSCKQIKNEAALSLAALHPNVVRTFHHFTEAGGDAGGRHVGGKVAASPRSGHGGYSKLTDLMDVANSQAMLPRTWIVLELCELGSLSLYLEHYAPRDKQGRMGHMLALTCALDVAQGMTYLHEHHICHGDLKASNILVMSSASAGGRPTCKISDFGLSRVMALNRSHLLTNTYGTVTHMPPELLLDGVLRQEGDVYSYGILLWEIISGKALCPDMNAAQIIQKVTVDNARPTFAAHVPDNYACLARDCWAADARHRPPFKEVVARLQAMLNQGACGQSQLAAAAATATSAASAWDTRQCKGAMSS